jgi:hypothetical protein
VWHIFALDVLISHVRCNCCCFIWSFSVAYVHIGRTDKSSGYLERCVWDRFILDVLIRQVRDN